MFKLKFQTEEINEVIFNKKQDEVAAKYNISKADATYFVFKGSISNTIYKPNEESINILYKDGTVKDISSIDDTLIHKTITATVKKNYICSI